MELKSKILIDFYEVYTELRNMIHIRVIALKHVFRIFKGESR